MFSIESVILLGGLLILLSIASSKFSARFGVPVLVLFLMLGMLTGSEGIGGIEFENYTMAHGVGTLALAIILFDGGLSTSMDAIRSAWKPAAVLATLGVLITSLVTGLAASWIMGVPPLEGLLLGSIVGSTDAAAIFAVLRSGGLHLERRVGTTVEVESGLNDPMAIFLTIGLLEILTGRLSSGGELVWLLATQMVVGTALGILAAYATVWLVNRIDLDAAGLYPILVTSCALLTFGATAWLGGSGFLAVYLMGIVVGARKIVFRRGVLYFHDAVAWLSQIVMFLVLGLLAFPSRLVGVAGRGLLISAILIAVARPLAVALSIWPFGFNRREFAFLSWAGLKGAVPITLATFPFLYGLTNARLLFDVVFFVVLISVVVQGWSLPLVARRLRLVVTPETPPPVTLEISSLRNVEGDIVDYSVEPGSRAAGRLVRELALPEGAVIAIVARQNKIIPPQGATRILEGDHVILVLSPGTKPLVDKVFGRGGDPRAGLPALFEFPLRGSTRVGELEDAYGILLDDAPAESTLDAAIRSKLGGQAVEEGVSVVFGPVALAIRGVGERGTIERIGMTILPTEGPPAPPLATPSPA